MTMASAESIDGKALAADRLCGYEAVLTDAARLGSLRVKKGRVDSLFALSLALILRF